jgi:hypothetical protein
MHADNEFAPRLQPFRPLHTKHTQQQNNTRPKMSSSQYQTSQFVSAIPHAFNLYASTNDAKADPPIQPMFTIPAAPKESIARLVEQPGTATPVHPSFANYPHGFPPSYGGVTGMPADVTDKVVIVSMLVGDFYAKNPEQAKATGALHIVGPDGGQGAVRDAKGAIVGTTKFTIYV